MDLNFTQVAPPLNTGATVGCVTCSKSVTVSNMHLLHVTVVAHHPLIDGTEGQKYLTTKRTGACSAECLLAWFGKSEGDWDPVHGPGDHDNSKECDCNCFWYSTKPEHQPKVIEDSDIKPCKAKGGKHTWGHPRHDRRIAGAVIDGIEHHIPVVTCTDCSELATIYQEHADWTVHCIIYMMLKTPGVQAVEAHAYIPDPPSLNAWWASEGTAELDSLLAAASHPDHVAKGNAPHTFDSLKLPRPSKAQIVVGRKVLP